MPIITPKPVNNTLKFVIFITLFLSLCGLFFKLMYWPGASAFFAAGALFFTLLYMPLITVQICLTQPDIWKRVLTICQSVIIMILGIGFTFSFLRFPGAATLLQLNKGLILGLLLPYALYHLFVSYKQPVQKTHARVLLIYFLANMLTVVLLSGSGKISIRPILQQTQKVEQQVRDNKNRNLQIIQYLTPLQFNNKPRFIAMRNITNKLWQHTQQFKIHLVNSVDQKAIPDTAWFSAVDIEHKQDYENTLALLFSNLNDTANPCNIKVLKQHIRCFNDTCAQIYNAIKKDAALKPIQINIESIKNEDGSTESWEQYYLLESPALSVCNIITDLQNEILNAEYQVLLEFVNQATQHLQTQQQFKHLLQHNINHVLQEQAQKLKDLNTAHENRQNTLNRQTKELQTVKDQNTLMILSIIIFLGLIAYVIFSNIQRKRLNTKLHAQNQKIEFQKTELLEKQHEILDSITYARRLQEAILPNKQAMALHFKQCEIYYKPKAIVAGDFYWFEQKQDWIYIAVADCTGHGVPGAMVSMVGYNALQRAVFEFNCVEPGAILDKARVLIAETFSNQKTETVKDGMDISLVAINKIQNTVLWAGAHNPLWTMDIHGLHEIKATKQSVGFAFDPKPFTTHAIPYQENLYIFLFTDGMPDQFGGAKGKKMKYKQFSELLMQTSQIKNAVEVLDQKFKEWMQQYEQIDDVCVIILQLK